MSGVPEGVAVVAQGNLGDLRELKEQLGGMGIRAELVAPPKERQSG